MPAGRLVPDRRGVVLALALLVGSTGLGLLLLLAGWGGESPPVKALLLVDGLSKMAALGALLWLLRRRPPPPAPSLAPDPRALRAGLLAGLAFLPVAAGVVLLQQYVGTLSGREVKAQALVERAISGDAGTFLLVAGFALLVAPLFEEMLFRGFLYEGVRAWTGPRGAALLTAALFGLFHGEVDAMPVTFLLGICLAYLRERTGGRTAPIAMHACYNAWQVGGMLLYRLAGSTGG